MVEAYGTKEVEKSFPKAQPEVIETPTFPGGRSKPMGSMVVVAPPPSPGA